MHSITGKKARAMPRSIVSFEKRAKREEGKKKRTYRLTTELSFLVHIDVQAIGASKSKIISSLFLECWREARQREREREKGNLHR